MFSRHGLRNKENLHFSRISGENCNAKRETASPGGNEIKSRGTYAKSKANQDRINLRNFYIFIVARGSYDYAVTNNEEK